MKLFVLVFTILFSFNALALKPCAPNVFTGTIKKNLDKWIELSSWTIEGKVISIDKKIEPYPNCTLKDRSQCTMLDISEMTIKIKKWHKGSGKSELKVRAEICAPPPIHEVGTEVFIFGKHSDNTNFYSFISRTKS